MVAQGDNIPKGTIKKFTNRLRVTLMFMAASVEAKVVRVILPARR